MTNQEALLIMNKMYLFIEYGDRLDLVDMICYMEAAVELSKRLQCFTVMPPQIRLLCKHKKVICVGYVLTGGDNNHYQQENVWQCQCCKKEFYGKMKK